MSSTTASVLLVDPDQARAEDSRRALGKAGLPVHTARTPPEALRTLTADRPWVVFIAFSVYREAGDQLLTAIRAECRDVASIVLTKGIDARVTADVGRFGAFNVAEPAEPAGLLPLYQLAFQSIQLRSCYDDPLRFTSGKAERAVLERATWRRLTTFMGQAISNASTQVLEDALGQSETTEAMTSVLKDALVTPAIEGEWAAALLEGAEMQRQILAEAGGALTAAQVVDLLGITRAAVDKRRKQHALLGIKLPSGDIAYPAAQFRKGDVVAGLPEVLRAFRIRDPWMQLDALLANDDALGGNAFDALARGDVDRVKARVSSFGDQGL